MMFRVYDLDAKRRYREAARKAWQHKRHGPTGKHGRRQTARERRALRRREMRKFEAQLLRISARTGHGRQKQGVRG